MKSSTYIIIYGRGGHQAQMAKLLTNGLFVDEDNINLIAITDSLNAIEKHVQNTITVDELRDKHSNRLTLLWLPLLSVRLIIRSLMLLKKHNIKGVISTGPGIAIIPCLIFGLFGKKIIVFESWSKFNQPSYTAKILYRFAGLFIVQHSSMLKVFPKAKYWGKL